MAKSGEDIPETNRNTDTAALDTYLQATFHARNKRIWYDSNTDMLRLAAVLYTNTIDDVPILILTHIIDNAATTSMCIIRGAARGLVGCIFSKYECHMTIYISST